MTIQNEINTGFGGECNYARLETYMSRKPDYTPTANFNEVQVGQYIKFINTDNQFRSGGIVLGTKDGEGGQYFLVRSYLYVGGKYRVFSLQFSDIKQLWIRDKVGKKPKKIVDDQPLRVREPKDTRIRFRAAAHETNFPVKINNEVVYYARDNYQRRRFMESVKFKKALNKGYVIR